MRSFFDRSVLVSLTAAVLIAGCGGGSSKVSVAEDAATAKGAVLTKADLPSDYDADPHDATTDLTPQQKGDFAKCMNTTTSPVDPVGAQKAISDDFSSDNTDVSEEVDIFSKKKDADLRMDVLRANGIERCLERMLAAVAEEGIKNDPDAEGATVGQIITDKMPVNGLKDKVAGFRSKAPFSSPDGDVDVYLDFIVVQHGRALVSMLSTSSGQPFDVGTEVSLLQKTLDRLGKKV